MIVCFKTQLNKLNHITLQRLILQVGTIMIINCIVMETLSSSLMVNGTLRRYYFFFAWTWWNMSIFKYWSVSVHKLLQKSNVICSSTMTAPFSNCWSSSALTQNSCYGAEHMIFSRVYNKFFQSFVYAEAKLLIRNNKCNCITKGYMKYTIKQSVSTQPIY